MDYQFISESIKQLGYNDFKYQFAATDICTFSDETSTMIVVSQNQQLSQQFKLKQITEPEQLGGYNFYFLDNFILDSPWLVDYYKMESIFNFPDEDYKVSFSKVKSFIEGVLEISQSLNHFCKIEYNSYDSVRIFCYSHKEEFLTEEDKQLANEIYQLYKSL